MDSSVIIIEDSDNTEVGSELELEPERKSKSKSKLGPRDGIVIGVDPGSVNCGICAYNTVTGEAVSLHRVEFRASKAGGKAGNDQSDLGNAHVIENIFDYVRRHPKLFRRRLIFVEDQHRYQEEKRQRYSKEVLAVQHAFQALFGIQWCIPVAPRGVKAYFGEYFPEKPGISSLPPGKRQAAQYAHDKRNAVENGRKFVPLDVQKKYDDENPGKKDDAYDAYWIARYGAERLVDERTGMRLDKPNRKKRKTKQRRREPKKKKRKTE